MEIEMHGKSHQGMVRINNEDSIGMLKGDRIAILADGMGGHQAGEVASKMAVDMVTQYFSGEGGTNTPAKESGNIREAIELANKAIYELSTKKIEYEGMGTTIVVSCFTDGKIIYGHVGDSRLYRLRKGELKQLTNDHSVIQELVSRGFMSEEEANTSMNKNLVTRALGIEGTVEVDHEQQECREGDIYLMCSDGLTDVLQDDAIQKLLSEEAELATKTTRLVDEANKAGGPDNISVITVRVSL